MNAQVKENPAQRVERIKKEKSGLDVLEDIHRYAISGDKLNPEDIDRFNGPLPSALLNLTYNGLKLMALSL